MKKEATVTVRVLVDETARPPTFRRRASRRIRHGRGGGGVRLELCLFTLATKNGVPVRMWMDIKVAFNLAGS